MSTAVRDWVIFLGLCLFGAFLQALSPYRGLPLLPFLFTVPTSIAWVLRKPFWPLLFLAVVLEFLSTVPIGFVAAVVFVPLVVFRLRGRIQADFSFSFAVLIIGTVILQHCILRSYDMLRALAGPSWGDVWLALPPLSILFWSTLLSAGYVFIVVIVIREMYPTEHRTALSLEGHRLSL